MERRGLVVARHRREVIVETPEGESLSGLVRGRALKPLAGDEVRWHLEADGTAVIEEVLPRRTLLERIDSRGRAEGVAANVSLIVIVVAPEPAPDWQLVDRYLVAAALLDIAAALVRNKLDLADAGLDARAAGYRSIGCEVMAASMKSGQGLDELRRTLSDHRGVLVGQSGVGKSSLINALLEAETQAVGRLSRRRPLGRHTTVAAMLHRLPGGGELIDSPGVRRYAPKISDPADLARGFLEFRPHLGRCRFNDCRHLSEPGCAVLAALERGEIGARRYLSYKALRATLEGLG